MSELSLTPFPAPVGLEALGSADAAAGVCVDGVCSVPVSEGDQDDQDDQDDEEVADLAGRPALGGPAR